MKTWDRFLNESGICESVYGNRSCDLGSPCELCQSEWVQDEYKKWLMKEGE